MLYLAFSRYGSIRLGRDDEEPEFRTVSWIAMMFSAGMGIGLMFFGVYEPITYLAAPPHGLAEANTKEAAELAMQFTYFHWAFHPWAIYAVVALSIAYFTFRKRTPNLVSSAFRPVLEARVERWPGKALDILAIFATLFGSCTSLGLGALQMNSGLNFIWGVPQTTTMAIIIIAVVTALFVVSPSPAPSARSINRSPVLWTPDSPTPCTAPWPAPEARIFWRTPPSGPYARTVWVSRSLRTLRPTTRIGWSWQATCGRTRSCVRREYTYR
jgi:BCCT, betaine/carnitine/choline family transporter